MEKSQQKNRLVEMEIILSFAAAAAALHVLLCACCVVCVCVYLDKDAARRRWIEWERRATMASNTATICRHFGTRPSATPIPSDFFANIIRHFFRSLLISPYDISHIETDAGILSSHLNECSYNQDKMQPRQQFRLCHWDFYAAILLLVLDTRNGR